MIKKCTSCNREDGLMVYRGVKGKDRGKYMTADGSVFDAKTHELLERFRGYSFFGQEATVKVGAKGVCRSCQNASRRRSSPKQLDMIEWIDGAVQ